MQVDRSDLYLERAYRWEKELANRRFMTQPLGGGRVREYTWAEAMAEARKIAQYIKSLNFPAKSNIAILAKNSAHFILFDLAIWMAGHSSVALYPTLTADIVRYILEHSESKLLFVGKLDTWDEMKPGVPQGLPCISCELSPKNDFTKWEDIVAKTPPIEGNPSRDPDETSMIIYTSGSTGKPKGVEHTFRTTAFAVKGFQTQLGWKQDDRMLSYLPLAHAFERAAVEGPSIYMGFQLFFAESLETFVEDVKRCRPTVFHSVPRLWLKFQQGVLKKMPEEKLRRMLKIPILSGMVRKKVLAGLGLDAARLAVTGSAPIPPELIQWYRDLGLELLEGYAMSENFSYSHLSLPGKTRVGYVGNTLPEVQVRITPEGEIQVKSDATMKGYYKEPGLTAEAFTPDRFLKTGDRGEIDSEGRLKITGRVKELFKTSKGKYVAPVPIENLLNADRRIEQSCVFGANQPQPFAVIVLNEELRKQLKNGTPKSDVEPGLAKLLADVNRQIPQYEQLELLVVAKDPWLIENGFLTPSMKIRRAIIEERYGPKIDDWYAARKQVLWEA
jgi:long-chain acyl-CoA synthetase